jgi:general secretion pathway protein G
MKSRRFNTQRGFSLLELLAVVTILGIIAAIIVPRVAFSSDTAKQRVQRVHEYHKTKINYQVDQWYISTSSWPANDLSDIAADINYFPDGIPVNPVDSSVYTLNATTHRVN